MLESESLKTIYVMNKQIARNLSDFFAEPSLRVIDIQYGLDTFHNTNLNSNSANIIYSSHKLTRNNNEYCQFKCSMEHNQKSKRTKLALIFN